MKICPRWPRVTGFFRKMAGANVRVLRHEGRQSAVVVHRIALGMPGGASQSPPRKVGQPPRRTTIYRIEARVLHRSMNLHPGAWSRQVLQSVAEIGQVPLQCIQSRRGFGGERVNPAHGGDVVLPDQDIAAPIGQRRFEDFQVAEVAASRPAIGETGRLSGRRGIENSRVGRIAAPAVAGEFPRGLHATVRATAGVDDPDAIEVLAEGGRIRHAAARRATRESRCVSSTPADCRVRCAYRIDPAFAGRSGERRRPDGQVRAGRRSQAKGFRSISRR